MSDSELIRTFNEFFKSEMAEKRKIEPTKSLAETKEKMKVWFEECFPIDNADRDFMIQYSAFEYEGPSDSPDEKGDQWYFNCCIPGTEDEGIYELKIVESDSTLVEIESWKGNYESFHFTDLLNRKNMSNERRVYLIDLYPDAKLKHFVGHCYTRGGFTGWNWFTF